MSVLSVFDFQEISKEMAEIEEKLKSEGVEAEKAREYGWNIFRKKVSEVSRSSSFSFLEIANELRKISEAQDVSDHERYFSLHEIAEELEKLNERMEKEKIRAERAQAFGWGKAKQEPDFSVNVWVENLKEHLEHVPVNEDELEEGEIVDESDTAEEQYKKELIKRIINGSRSNRKTKEEIEMFPMKYEIQEKKERKRRYRGGRYRKHKKPRRSRNVKEESGEPTADIKNPSALSKHDLRHVIDFRRYQKRVDHVLTGMTGEYREKFTRQRQRI